METRDFAEKLTARQVAQFLSLPQSMVNRLIRERRIKQYGAGSNTWFLKSELERLIQNITE